MLRGRFGRAGRGIALFILWIASSPLLYIAPPLHAQPSAEDRTAAKAAYDDALRLAGERNLRAAAEAFARADELAPNVVALTSAIRAAVDADDGPLAMNLAERAAARLRAASGAKDRALASLAAEAENARKKYASVTGRLRIDCEDLSPCVARLGDREIAVSVETWVAAGPQTVTFEIAGRPREVSVSVAPGGLSTVVPPDDRPADAGGANEAPVGAPSPTTAQSRAPEPTPPAPGPRAQTTGDEPVGAPTSSGIHPAWFWTGLATTVVLGGVTIGSAVDTMNLHDEFLSSGTGAGEGESAQTRTNALLGVTLGLGVATILLAVFTDWNDAEVASASSWHRVGAPRGVVF